MSLWMVIMGALETIHSASSDENTPRCPTLRSVNCAFACCHKVEMNCRSAALRPSNALKMDVL